MKGLVKRYQQKGRGGINGLQLDSMTQCSNQFSSAVCLWIHYGTNTALLLCLQDFAPKNVFSGVRRANQKHPDHDNKVSATRDRSFCSRRGSHFGLPKPGEVRFAHLSSGTWDGYVCKVLFSSLATPVAHSSRQAVDLARV